MSDKKLTGPTGSAPPSSGYWGDNPAVSHKSSESATSNIMPVAQGPVGPQVPGPVGDLSRDPLVQKIQELTLNIHELQNVCQHVINMYIENSDLIKIYMEELKI